MIREIDIASYDLDDGRSRQRLLEKIPPDRATAKKLHQVLLDLFRREMASRRREGYDLEDSFFENLYWCALLLYLIGDPADVSLMWEAKHINMDAGCSFDGQFLVGAGVEETIKYLEERGQKAPADYLKELSPSKNWTTSKDGKDSEFTTFTQMSLNRKNTR